MSRFNGLDEGLATSRYFFSHLPFFFRVVTIWCLVTGSYEWLVIHLYAYEAGLIPWFFGPVTAAMHISRGFVVIAVLLPYRILWLIASCAIAVTFHRAVVEGYRPVWPISPINGRWLRYLWAIFLVSSAVRVAVRATLGENFSLTPPSASSQQLGDILSWVFLTFVSLAGLRLTAIAVGNKTLDLGLALSATRPIALSFMGGFLLAYLPLLLASQYLILLNPLSPAGASDIGELILALIAELCSFGGVACAAIYLSRAYVALSPTFVQFPVK